MRYNDNEQKVYDMDIMKKLLPFIWFIVKYTWKIVSGFARLLLVAFCGYGGSPPRRPTAHQESNLDSAWDIHPKHYYDKDPPPPFS